MFDIEKIQKILPQRYPFLMIDRVLEITPGEKAVAIKNVSINDGFFIGHFPGKPVMPGVLIIEAMAQAAILLFYKEGQEQAGGGKSFYLASVKARFLNPVFPGDQIRIVVAPVKVLSAAAIVNAQVFVQENEVAKGELSFSVKED